MSYVLDDALHWTQRCTPSSGMIRPTSRAGTSRQRSQANAFAKCGLSGHAGGPVKQLAGPQHRVHHDRELSGDCDGGTLEADPFLELEPPCPKGALS